MWVISRPRPASLAADDREALLGEVRAGEELGYVRRCEDDLTVCEALHWPKLLEATAVSE